MFVQFSRYLLILYPFGWGLSGKKKIKRGHEVQSPYPDSQSPTYLNNLIQLHLNTILLFNTPRAFTLAVPVV